ncbi:MAG TPA: hypothetical protein VFY90_06095, partial [Tepidiformaceae bacterium]|nr:hypothetical protein [Tepidiformaceae bacterium]
MTDALRVGQFAIVDHEPVDRGPNAGVFHGKGPHDDRAELFIGAEGTTPAGEAFAGHVVSALGSTFASLDMSLTGALRRLFLEAEQNVRDWNNRSIAQHHVSLGMSCFARRGGQAVVAQAGPTVAFHLSMGRVTAYAPERDHARPIGDGITTPQLTRIPFDRGDRLLMISTAAAEELDDEIIGGILALPGDQVLADLYHRVSHLRHLTAVLVTTVEPEVHKHEPTMYPQIEEDNHEDVIDATRMAAPQPEEESPGDAYQPSLFIEDEGADAIDTARRQLLELRPRARVEAELPAALAGAPVPLQRASGDSGLAMLVAESQARAARSQALLASSATLAAPRTMHRSGGTAVVDAAMPEERRRQRRDSFSRGLVREETAPPPSSLTDNAPRCDELAADTQARTAIALPTPVAATIAGQSAATVGSGGSLVRMRGNMGGRWKGSSGGGASVAAGQFPPTWLVIVVGLSLLVGLVGVLVVPRALQSERGNEYADLVDKAQQQLAAAHALPDLAKRREALTAAHALLLEAQEVDGTALAETTLLPDVEAELAAMDNVHEPQLVETIASLEQFGDKPVAVTRMAASESRAYLLDNTSGRVIAVTVENGEKQVVYEENKEARRGHPISVAFFDRSEFAGPAVVVADANSNLWARGSGELQPLAFAAPQNLMI